jgi:hypothetical protein
MKAATISKIPKGRSMASRDERISERTPSVATTSSHPKFLYDLPQDQQPRRLSLLTLSSTPSKPTLKMTHTRPPLPVVLSFIALCLSIFLVALDTVLIPTALPTIALSFHIPDDQYAWIGSAYLLANATSVPFWGKLSDIFGRKPVILTADAIFLGGSILCGASGDAATLLGGRVIQGIGGGGVVVLVHICTSDLFSIR